MTADKYLKLVGKRIKELRKAKDITQDNLAFDCHTSKAGISRMEAGKNNFTIKTLLKVADSLEVSIHDLLPKDWNSIS